MLEEWVCLGWGRRTESMALNLVKEHFHGIYCLVSACCFTKCNRLSSLQWSWKYILLSLNADRMLNTVCHTLLHDLSGVRNHRMLDVKRPFRERIVVMVSDWKLTQSTSKQGTDCLMKWGRNRADQHQAWLDPGKCQPAQEVLKHSSMKGESVPRLQRREHKKYTSIIPLRAYSLQTWALKEAASRGQSRARVKSVQKPIQTFVKKIGIILFCLIHISLFAYYCCP